MSFSRPIQWYHHSMQIQSGRTIPLNCLKKKYENLKWAPCFAVSSPHKAASGYDCISVDGKSLFLLFSAIKGRFAEEASKKVIIGLIRDCS